jgi:two-component system sensor histidine kinase ChvG
MSTTAPSTATSSDFGRSSAPSPTNSTPSRRSTASATAIKNPDAQAERRAARRRRRAERHGFRPILFSRLTRLILLANLTGLAILTVGALALGEMRQGLIEARIASLRTQGELIANVLAEGATEEQDPRPELDLDAARTILRTLYVPESVRVRLFSTEGEVLTDSFLLTGQVARRILPALDEGRIPELRPFDEQTLVAAASERTLEEEFSRALLGEVVENRRENEEGERVVSVSIPVQRVQAVVGVLTIEAADVDAIIAAERRALTPFFIVAFAVTLVSSMLITLFVARPIRKLARAADVVREAGPRHASIPDLSSRRDEIGDLSVTLSGMTDALAERIDAIEAFAADVAHEVKNPLTSIRSALETLPQIADEARRAKLLDVMRHDVQRIDRLITDISNASRLDAELSRAAAEPLDIVRLLKDMVELYAGLRGEGEAKVVFAGAPQRALIHGSEEPLGQVFRNLIDNARTFSPAGGTVRLAVSGDPGAAYRPGVRVTIEDDGPGVPEENLERIFDRFYTERPKGAAFGSHSGLGLAIARQIVSAHQGRIFAENRVGADNAVAGARFVVDLPQRRR